MIHDFSYQAPTRIHFGKTALSHLREELDRYGKNVLLVYGKNSIKRTGIYDKVIEILKEADKSVSELSGVKSNPTYEQVMAGAKIARECKADLILAVGGGSVIDCAKGISVYTYAQCDVWKEYYMNWADVKNQTIPVGCVLTMAGTGSEMNSTSVITNDDTHTKTGRTFPMEQVAPKFAILNPEFTYTVPKEQMTSGIFDILSHLMEQYFGGEGEHVCDAMIEGVMRSLLVSARQALKNPTDYDARSNIMWCATMGLNRLLAVGKEQDWNVHKIEHQLGAYTDCPHGIGLAVISPTYYRYIYKAGLHQFVRFAKNVWNVDDKGLSPDEVALQGIDRMEAFIRELGIPSTLHEIGTTEEMLPLIANSVIFADGYMKLTPQDVLTILKAVY